jgi:hypothetical protein
MGGHNRIGRDAPVSHYTGHVRHTRLGGHLDRTGWGGGHQLQLRADNTLLHHGNTIKVGPQHIEFNGTRVRLGAGGLARLAHGLTIRAEFHPNTSKFMSVAVTDRRGGGFRFTFNADGVLQGPPQPISLPRTQHGQHGHPDRPPGRQSHAGRQGPPRRHRPTGHPSGAPDSSSETQPVAFNFPPQYDTMLATLDRIKTGRTADAQTVSALQGQLAQLAASIGSHQGQLAQADLQKIRDLGAAFIAAADALPADQQTIATQLRTMGRQLLPSSTEEAPA